jgi:hypothetical protein
MPLTASLVSELKRKCSALARNRMHNNIAFVQHHNLFAQA